MQKFGANCRPHKNLLYECYKYWKRDQEEGETIDQYLVVIRTQTAMCEFEEFGEEETMIRDKLVFGVRDERTKEKLLREGEVTLQKAIDICHAAEASKQGIEGIKSTATAKQVNALRAKKPRTQASTKAVQVQPKAHSPSQQGSIKKACEYCGKKHLPGARKCPAFRRCSKCRDINRCASICKTAVRKVTVVGAAAEDASSPREYLVIGPVLIDKLAEENAQTSGRWQEKITVGQTEVDFKLDTREQANVLLFDTFKKATPGHTLTPTEAVLTAFGKGKIHPLGGTVIPCMHRRKNWHIKFYVAEKATVPILGHNTCEKLDLIKRIDTLETPLTKDKLMDEHTDAFTGTGQFKQEYEIELDPSVGPVIQPPRRVPYAKIQKLKDTLAQLEKQGIVTKVDGPTDWVSNLVIMEKKDKRVRVCLDLKPLNQAIKRKHYVMLTPADVQTQLYNKTVFSIIDMKNG